MKVWQRRRYVRKNESAFVELGLGMSEARRHSQSTMGIPNNSSCGTGDCNTRGTSGKARSKANSEFESRRAALATAVGHDADFVLAVLVSILKLVNEET